MGYRHDLAARTQFVLVAICGCPLKVLEGSTVPGPASAMREFADHNLATVEKWEEQGLQVRHIPHGDYIRDYADRLRPTYRCTHRGTS